MRLRGSKTYWELLEQSTDRRLLKYKSAPRSPFIFTSISLNKITLNAGWGGASKDKPKLILRSAA
jgi:hypothetical protein